MGRKISGDELLMSLILPKTQEKRFQLEFLYMIKCPVINMPTYEDWLDEDQRIKYKLEAMLHIKETFEKEECPDYHAMIYLSEASLMSKPSDLFGRIYMSMSKKYWGKKLDFGIKEYDEIKLDENELYEQTKLKKWILK